MVDTDEMREPHKRSQSTERHPLISNFKPLYLLSVLVALLAVSFAFAKTNCFKSQLLRSTLSSDPRLFHKLLSLLHPIQYSSKTLTPRFNSLPPRCVLWMAPFLSGGGYSSEAWSYILSLHQHLETQETTGFRLSIQQHGDQDVLEFWEGLPREMKILAFELYQTECRVNETIVICHSEPGAWYPPLFQTIPCPPRGYGNFKFVIGRTMFETDRVNPEHVRRCNQMDSVWVPTEFHVSTFIKSGVHPSKVVKIIQPVDVNFFDPFKHRPLDLASRGTLVLGSTSRDSNSKKDFIFLSIFKWEYRKGWDVLLKSYLKEFSGDDGVALFLLTNPYHSDSDFSNKILEFVQNSDLEKSVGGWAPVYVIDTHIAQVDLPRLYMAADAFVLPSRGEGWGRPLVEAMAMSLPVIATNWSGPTEYLTEGNGYPLPVDRMSEVMEGPFKGHLWAEPSIRKLQVLMRHVMKSPEEAKARGCQARKDMVSKFSPKVVAGIVTDHVQKILKQNDMR